MKQFLIFILIAISSINVYSQTPDLVKLINEGKGFNKLSMYENAVNSLKNAISIEKKSPEANDELAFAYFGLGMYKEAIKCCDRVLDNDDYDRQRAYTIMARSYELLKKLGDAEDTYEDAIEDYPNNLNFKNGLASVLIAAKEYEDAEKILKEVINKDKTQSKAHYLLSQINYAYGLRVRTLYSTMFALLIEPNSQNTRNYIANIEHMFNLKDNRFIGYLKFIEQNNNIYVFFYDLSNEDPDYHEPEEVIRGNVFANIEKGYTVDSFKKFRNDMETFMISLKKCKEFKDNFWADNYTKKFIELYDNYLIDAFSYYILQSKYPQEFNKWANENPGALIDFKKWLTKEGIKN